jgi:hypothetical protein
MMNLLAKPQTDHPDDPVSKRDCLILDRNFKDRGSAT